MLNQLPQVTKNLLILNIAFFLLTFFFKSRGLDLSNYLGAHYMNTGTFEPYQVVTHFFMHGGIFHIFMNMYVLVMFGGFLERLWGPKRFFIVYVSSALGAYLLYTGVGYFQIEELKASIGNREFISIIDGVMAQHLPNEESYEILVKNIGHLNGLSQESFDLGVKYLVLSGTPMVGASGAIFGIMAAFAVLFPNTELQLLFPPIPIKAKYLIGGYFLLELYSSFQINPNDHTAHLAHVGGAIVGAIIVIYWRKRGQNFY